MQSQWDGLRQNLGEWHGSFTQCSPQGEILNDTPSILNLEETAEAETIQLTLSRFPVDGAAHEMKVSFTYPGPGDRVLFFETGAFVQGSVQWSPLSQFGAEMAFIHGDRRLRLVQLFEGQANGTSQLSRITVIREARAGCSDPPSPALKIVDLQGRWQGHAVIISSNNPHPVKMSTSLTVAVDGADITQTLSYGAKDQGQDHPNAPMIETFGRAEANEIRFGQGDAATRVMLLPGGGSVVVPDRITGDRPFFIESGWLIAPQHRQRLIRRFDSKGQWLDLIWVEEFKDAAR
ncbi:MAG: DUF3598 family protein [Leptolyngbyaceae cyanobacterium]